MVAQGAVGKLGGPHRPPGRAKLDLLLQSSPEPRPRVERERDPSAALPCGNAVAGFPGRAAWPPQRYARPRTAAGAPVSSELITASKAAVTSINSCAEIRNGARPSTASANDSASVRSESAA